MLFAELLEKHSENLGIIKSIIMTTGLGNSCLLHMARWTQILRMVYTSIARKYFH
jgi:hypothetical protein